MKIYDISQEIIHCDVYPGDERPQKRVIERISEGSLYNLTSFSMCAHNGTHIDAPFHFFQDGKTIESMPLEKVIGWCYVKECQEEITREKALEMITSIQSISLEASKRILIKGKGVLTLEGAKVFREAKIVLVGSESQSVGPVEAPMAVHKELLQDEIVLLEGIRLKDVEEGIYLLNAAPLSLSGFDGSPCRAVLIEMGD